MSDTIYYIEHTIEVTFIGTKYYLFWYTVHLSKVLFRTELGGEDFLLQTRQWETIKSTVSPDVDVSFMFSDPSTTDSLLSPHS